MINHRKYVEINNWGFGEIPFHYLWLLLINQMPSSFRFLEIGIYKSSIMSLVKLCSDKLKKTSTIYGISPLDSTGDKYLLQYEQCDYHRCIAQIFADHQLDISTTTILKGRSTDPIIKESIIEEHPFDMVYIDGSHNYEDVVSDIELTDKLLTPNGYLIMDDASSYLNLGKLSIFKGHVDVSDAIKNKLDNNKSYVHLLACGHNRVWRKQ